MRALAVAVLVATCLCADDSRAHSRSESYSHWYVGETSLTGTVTIPLREVMLLYQGADATIPPRELFRDHLLGHTRVRGTHADCGPAGSDVLEAPSGFVRVELRFSCGGDVPSYIHFRALFGAAPAHVNYARLHRDGRQLGETLFTEASDAWDIRALRDAASAPSLLSFFEVGVRHIAGGIDHIAFLLGLMLVAGTPVRTVIAVTGFTAGHSLSLAAAVLGLVHADGRLVEAFIGFTVALVAIEYFLLRGRDPRPFAAASLLVSGAVGLSAFLAGSLTARALLAYAGFGIFAACYLLGSRALAGSATRATQLIFTAALGFGLVHGFGFAGFLMETGMLGASLFKPLLGFNLGVEAGQLALVAVVLMLASLVRTRLPAALPQVVAAGICGLGVFWFVGRSFG